jgi:hypothetical protein
MPGYIAQRFLQDPKQNDAYHFGKLHKSASVDDFCGEPTRLVTGLGFRRIGIASVGLCSPIADGEHGGGSGKYLATGPR